MKAAVDRLFGVAKSLDIRSNFPQFQTVFNRRFWKVPDSYSG